MFHLLEELRLSLLFLKLNIMIVLDDISDTIINAVLDHKGRVKQPCCIDNADNNSLKPICEQCVLGCYSVLVTPGIRGKI